MRLEKSFSLPIFLSVSLHTLLLVLFLGNWSFFKKEPEPYKPHYVTATLMDMKPKAKAAPQQTKEQVLDSKAYEDLKNNNNKEWFHENKKRYDLFKKEYQNLIAEILQEMKPFYRHMPTTGMLCTGMLILITNYFLQAPKQARCMVAIWTAQ